MGRLGAGKVRVLASREDFRTGQIREVAPAMRQRAAMRHPCRPGWGEASPSDPLLALLRNSALARLARLRQRLARPLAGARLGFGFRLGHQQVGSGAGGGGAVRLEGGLPG